MNAEQDGGDLELRITGVAVQPHEDGAYLTRLGTTRGEISAVLHPHEGGTGAVIFVGGAMGGLDGPADHLYARLAPRLLDEGVTSLRVEYRKPGEFFECVLDTLGGMSFLTGIGARRVVLVGHSFGGAVVIKAGELSNAVTAVAAMSSQLYGADNVQRLAPKALLLVHGDADDVLDAEASQLIYDRAGEPKQIVIYPEAGHGLLEAREEVFDLLLEWIPAQLRLAMDC